MMDYQKENAELKRLLREKEIDLVRQGRLNEMLRMANVQLAEENRELKRRLEGRCSA